MSINKSITAVMLGSLSSRLGSLIRLGENSGRGCLLLTDCLPLFLGVSGLTTTFFVDLDLGVILVKRRKKPREMLSDKICLER